MAKRRIEEKHQVAMVEWFRYQYPKLEDLLYVIANGENVGPVRMIRLKQLGLVPGMTDLALAVGRKGFNALYIEMKKPDGHLQKNQIEIHAKLRAENNKVITPYGIDDAIVQISDYLR